MTGSTGDVAGARMCADQGAIHKAPLGFRWNDGPTGTPRACVSRVRLSIPRRSGPICRSIYLLVAGASTPLDGGARMPGLPISMLICDWVMTMRRREFASSPLMYQSAELFGDLQNAARHCARMTQARRGGLLRRRQRHRDTGSCPAAGVL